MNKFLNQSAINLGFKLTDSLLDALGMYSAPGRYYHNSEHIRNMLYYVDKHYTTFLAHETRLLKVAILFHDIVYTPGYQYNELASWHVCEQICKEQNIYCDTENLGWLEKMIMATKDHLIDADSPEIIRAIVMADLDGFCHRHFELAWQGNVKIFKEFQRYDWKEFQEGQIDFLQKFKDKVSGYMPQIALNNMDDICTVMKVWQPNIAIYPGSFNPFHIGHLNILQKAERIFDKVIIARGINPEKENEIVPLPDCLSHYQVDNYNGLLTDYLLTKDYPVTVIRGLRNTTDMAYEQNQYRWLQDLDPGIKMVSLFCDKEYEHISSSGIRLMKKFNKQPKYLIS